MMYIYKYKCTCVFIKVYLQYDASASDDLLMVLIKSQQDELLKTNSELNTYFEKFPPVSPYEIKPGNYYLACHLMCCLYVVVCVSQEQVSTSKSGCSTFLCLW